MTGDDPHSDERAKRPVDRSWPVREEGWEGVLIARVRTLFAELAERHGLEMEWNEDAPLDVCCTFPAQPGLDFSVSMALSNSDELTLFHDWFWVDIFPADRESSWWDFERFADGLLSGEARALIHHCGDPKRYYKTEAQICEGGRWRSVSTGLAPWRWRPWARQVEIVQNSRR